jgi:mRNA interferase YafQ
MREVYETRQFRNDIKKIKKRGNNLGKLKRVVEIIASGAARNPRFRDHALGGQWMGSRDCHIEPDWLLIYRIDGESLYLERTGSHSDLFKK